MTPLEKARAKENEPPACMDCPRGIRINKTLFCEVNGKIILPMFEHISICKGSRLKAKREE